MDYKQLKQEAIDKAKAMLQEEYQVVILPTEFKYYLRFTYSHRKGGRITELEEVTSNDEVITSCKFKGKTANGTGCDYLKPIKQAFSTMKIEDWIHNDFYVEEYYKNN